MVLKHPLVAKMAVVEGEKCSEVHIQLLTLVIEPSGALSALHFSILLMGTH